MTEDTAYILTNTPRLGESPEQIAARTAPRNVPTFEQEVTRFVRKANGDDREDAVNHPPHYNAHPSGIECIQITEHMNFNVGNAVKYIWRAGLKSDDPVTDLEKARWYLEREIARLKRTA